jgi:hypothetical protein
MSHHRYAGLLACLALGFPGMSAAAEEQLPVLRPVGIIVKTPVHPAEKINIRRLGPNDDYSIFVDEDCPDEVHKRALRHLWKMLPKAEPGYDLG